MVFSIPVSSSAFGLNLEIGACLSDAGNNERLIAVTTSVQNLHHDLTAFFVDRFGDFYDG